MRGLGSYVGFNVGPGTNRRAPHTQVYFRPQGDARVPLSLWTESVINRVGLLFMCPCLLPDYGSTLA